MSISRPEEGFKKPIRAGSIAFEFNGSVFSLPGEFWKLLAGTSLYSSASVARPLSQVVWLEAESEEAERIISGIAPGARVTSFDSVQPDKRSVVVYGPESRHRAIYVEGQLDAPVLLSVGDERPAPSLLQSKEGAERSIHLIGDSCLHAATLAGVLAALTDIWPGSSASELAQILIYMAD
jgi:hypothetical protein